MLFSLSCDTTRAVFHHPLDASHGWYLLPRVPLPRQQMSMSMSMSMREKIRWYHAARTHSLTDCVCWHHTQCVRQGRHL